MNIAFSVKKFLEKQLKLHKINNKSFAGASNITYNTVCCIMNCKRNDTRFDTIIKIASYFNCSIDEVLNRKNYINNNIYYDVNYVLENYNKEIRDFLLLNIEKYNLNPYTLSCDLGFHNSVIQQFITETTKTRSLTTPVIIAVADYFKISIDKMINRITIENSMTNN